MKIFNACEDLGGDPVSVTRLSYPQPRRVTESDRRVTKISHLGHSKNPWKHKGQRVRVTESDRNSGIRAHQELTLKVIACGERQTTETRFRSLSVTRTIRSETP